jgi:hypothetical protein
MTRQKGFEWLKKVMTMLKLSGVTNNSILYMYCSTLPHTIVSDRGDLYIICNPLSLVYKRAEASTIQESSDRLNTHTSIVTHAP